MKTPDKVYWSYLAGMFDGEGTFSIYHHKGQSSTGKPYDSTAIRIEVTNTNVALMEWFVSHFGGQYYHHRRANLKHKIAYGWRPKGRANSEQLLLGILPYLVIKKEQAKIALEYIRLPHNNGFDETLAAKRKELLEKMQTLNKRGSESLTTNTQEASESIPRWEDQEVKIESELMGDHESAPDVNQGFD